MSETALIIGAGPAGLTAAFELATRTGVQPIVLEQSHHMGGLSRTVNYKGNRLDIGGHRFFSKSDRVMDWWLQILPMQASQRPQEQLTYQNQTRCITSHTDGPDPDREDKVMLVCRRLSRIYFTRKFFKYPISLSFDTLLKLGPVKVLRIGASYLRSAMFKRPEHTLEDFFINRFGHELYTTFFQAYTEKVWGVPCDHIGAEWGAQRVKGLSIYSTLLHAVKQLRREPNGGDDGMAQKRVETSLIEQFLYPKYGPGQMWEEVAQRVQQHGGQILTGWSVEKIEHSNDRIAAVWARSETGESRRWTASHYFSTMPVQHLIRVLTPEPPAKVRKIAEGLMYRDFITVGMLCKRLRLKDDHTGGLVKDNWIYIQEPDVLVGRLQIFNNWSPYLVADPSTVWIGLEYFCQDTDEIWHKSDPEIIELARQELASMNILDRDDYLDATVVRMPKTYPAYFGTYAQFPEIIQWTDRLKNLFLIGRNGMHKYNNQDHSMLTAMVAVDNIIAGVECRENLWSLNTQTEYHEEKPSPVQKTA